MVEDGGCNCNWEAAFAWTKQCAAYPYINVPRSTRRTHTIESHFSYSIKYWFIMVVGGGRSLTCYYHPLLVSCLGYWWLWKPIYQWICPIPCIQGEDTTCLYLVSLCRLMARTRHLLYDLFYSSLSPDILSCDVCDPTDDHGLLLITFAVG